MRDGQAPPRPLHPLSAVIHVSCSACGSRRAIVAATTFNERLCFCPACEHVWDCEKLDPAPADR